MINNLFGSKIDIHGGGVDLKFPHHENEIAQSKALNNNYLANYWMHNGHINVDGTKMSKSLNNFILAKDFIKKYRPNVIKLAMFKTHYRLPFNISDDLFNEAITLDERIYNSLKQASVKIQVDNIKYSKLMQDVKINEIMDDDFNTPNLISYLLELVKELNSSLRTGLSFTEIYDKINLIVGILGLHYEMPTMSEDDLKTYNAWLTAKKEKNFNEADKLRTQLIDKNIL